MLPLLFLIIILSVAGATANAAPATPTSPSPGSTASPGPTTSSSTVTLRWNSSTGATSYGLGVRDLSTNVLVVDTNVSGTSYTANLSAGKQYRWNVNACNSTGCSSYTTPLYFQTPGAATIPGTPTSPSPGSTSSPGPTTSGNSVTLRWSGSSGASYYGLGVRDITTNVLVVDTNVSGTSYTASLSAGRQYRWNVNACNGSGCSSYTTALYFQTPSAVAVPATPSNPSPGSTGSPGPTTASNSVTVSWSPSSGATFYGLGVRDVATNALVVDTNVSGTSYSANLSAGKQYRWNVSACNSAGCSNYTTPLYFQTPGAVTIPATPASPSPGSTTSPGTSLPGNSVTLTWSGSSGATSYGLGVRDVAANVLVVDTNVSGTSYTANLTAGKQYRWNVNACNSAGCSGYTTPLYFKTAGTLPGSLTLSNNAPVCDTNTPVAPAIRLNWTASSGATSYDLYRNGSLYGTGLSGLTFYNSVNVVAGQTYTYFVRARNSYGTVDSNTVTINVPPGVCTAAANPPTITSINPSSVTVNQTTVLTVNGSNFQGGFSAAVTTSLGTFNIAGTGLTYVNSAQVLVQVTMGGVPPLSATLRITNPDGQSATGVFQVASQQSVPGGFTLSNQAPVCDTAPPAAPAVRINWTAANGAATYDVYRNGSPYSSGITGTTYYNSANVLAGQTYTYFVRARNSAGTTDSNTVTVAVPAGVCSAPVLSPVIDRITPSNVTINQTTLLTVTGSNFQSNLGVTVQGFPIASTGVRFISGNEVTVSVKMGGTPPYAATLVLTNVASGQSAKGSFTVAAAEGAPTAPTAAFTFSPESPRIEESIQFTDGSSGQGLAWEWDFDGDGAADSRSQNPRFTFLTPGARLVTLRVTNAYGVDELKKALVVSTTAGTPLVTDVIRKYAGFFLKGSGLDNVFDVRVNWNGSPGTVALTVDGGGPITKPGSAGGASFTLNLDRDFTPKFSPSVVRITPTNGEGVVGSSATRYVYVFPYPSWLTATVGRDSSALRFTAGNGQIRADLNFDFPSPHLAQEGPIDIPSWVPYIGGKFGLEETYAQVGGSFSSTGSGSVRLGGQTGFAAMGQSLRGSLFGSGSFLINESGLILKSTSFNLGLSGTLRKEVGVIDAIPQLAAIQTTPVIGRPLRWFNEKAKLIGEVSPSLQFGANWAQDQTGSLNFNSATGTLGLKLSGTLKVTPIDHLRASGSVSGGGSFTLGVPGRFVKGADITFSSKVSLNIDYFLGSTSFEKKAAYRCVWSPGTGTSCGRDGASSSVRAEMAVREDVPLTLIQPSFDSFGQYSAFHGSDPQIRLSSSEVPASVSDMTLVSNVFQGATPKVIAVGPGSLLLWAQQDPSLPVLQSTDVAWSYNSGADAWTQPALVAHDTRAEIAPVAGVDAGGRVVAAWLRVKDTNFVTPVNNTSDLPLFYKRFDIVSATFDPLAPAWGAVSNVTDDGVMDTSLRLSSDGAGRLLLTWLANAAGEFMSDPTNPSALKYSFWNGTSWGTPATIGNNLAGVSNHVAAIKDTGAFLIVPRDPDPSVAGDGVLDLYRWNGTAWGAPSVYAGGGTDNRLPSAVYTSDGEGHVVWLRGNDLVHATLSNPTPRVVRGGSTSMAFYNVQLCTNPQGNLTLTWAEVVDSGPANIVAVLFDPDTQTWSGDRRLTTDSALAHDVSAYYGSDGQLRAAYLATQISRTTETVVVDGTPLTISNVPQEGRSDLRVLSHSLINDLAVTDADLAVVLPQPGNGGAASATLDVHNAGDFAVGNFVVNLYVGDPSAGGSLVGSVTVSDLLRAGDHRLIPFNFQMPAGGGNFVAVVDVNNSVAEFTKANNRATFYRDNTAPQTHVSATVTGGTAPLTVGFDASATFDAEGEPMSFTWAFADGSAGVGGSKVSHTFNQPGVYAVTVAVKDARGAVGTGVVTITVSPARAAQFNTAFYDLGEGGGSVAVTVTRSGDVSGAAAVDYQTADGTATARSDYTNALGTLRFAPGEAAKTFTIFITDDGYVEGPETIVVTLTNPNGMGLGFPSSALITVSDNDAAAPSTNPIEAAQYFVRQHYRDFLNRDPDQAGLQFWTNEINSCGADAQCREVKRINVSAAFFLSIEFQETGYLVYRMYKAAFGDQAGKPTPVPLREFLADTQEIGQGVQVNVGNWQQQLESNKIAFAARFAARSQFTSLYTQEMTAAQFVDALNVNVGTALSQSERDALVSALSSGAKTRAQVLRAVAEDADFAKAQSNKAFVLMQYFGYLRRNPDDLPDNDFSGYQFWLGKLNQFNGNFVQAEMVKAFLEAIEYRRRFAP